MRRAEGAEVDQREIEDLYALQREEFLPARQALAKRLKEAGDGDGARQVAALRKPTVAAWALNRLARTEARGLDELFRAGERVARAQRAGTSGREDFRSAIQERRQFTAALVQSAERSMAEAGYRPNRAHLDRVAETLEAATADEAARRAVTRGMLEKELPPPVAFGGPDLRSVPEPETDERDRPAAKRGRSGGGTAKGRGVKPSPKEDRVLELASRPSKRERDRAARTRERAERLAGEADGAETEARRLRDEAARAERAAIKARDAAGRAERKAAQARTRAEQAARMA